MRYLFLIMMFFASSLHADTPGKFDYYIAAFSWNSGWCKVDGDYKNANQCKMGSGLAFTMHGLWPQNKEGWPEFCQSNTPNPSRSDTKNMVSLFGSSGSAWHQWDKHGRCSGLSYQEYYALTQKIFDGFHQPAILNAIEQPLQVTSQVIEDAIIEANPKLSSASIAVICKKGEFVEARICYDRDFEPMACLGNAADDCAYAPEILPVR